MYWVNQFGHTLWSANQDGTDQQVLVSGLAEPTNIALDLASDKLYIADWLGTIERVNLDGTGLETLITGQNGAEGIALDIVRDKVYWASALQGSIQRANLDGTDLETLVTGLSSPVGIALQIEAAPVPEPSALLLLGIGTLGLIGYTRWRKSV
jgi:hypothetical protein